MSQIDLEIIIVNYNSEFWLKKTLTSLKAEYLSQTHYSVIVTVVDNGSSDGSLAMLEKDFSWVSLINLQDNNGFAVANNAALSLSKARYQMLLNSDVEFTENSNLDTLIEYLDAHRAVGMVTPKVLFSTGELDPASHRGEPTLWASFSYFAGLEKLWPKSKLFGQYHQGYKDLNTLHEVDACSGAAVIVRRAAVKKVGLLDERFFMYAEDLDWCRRFREAGYTIIYNPEVEVIHHKYKSGLRNSSQTIARNTRRHFYDTMLQYYDKHYRKQYPEFVRQVIRYFIVIKKGAI